MEMAVQLARALGMGTQDIAHLRRGARLHDIGKMGVPDGILLKPGPPTEDERTAMRRHPEYAHELLSPSEYRRPALDIDRVDRRGNRRPTPCLGGPDAQECEAPRAGSRGRPAG